MGYEPAYLIYRCPNCGADVGVRCTGKRVCQDRLVRAASLGEGNGQPKCLDSEGKRTAVGGRPRNY